MIKHNVLPVLAICLLLTMSLLLCYRPTPIAPSVDIGQAQTTLKKNHQQQQQVRVAKSNSLNTKRKILHETLQRGKQKVLEVNKKQHQKETEIHREQANLFVHLDEDSAMMFSSCDSLQNNVTDYITIIQEKDTLIAQQILFYEQTIQLQDSNLFGLTQDYALLEKQVDTLLTWNEQLQKQNTQYKKALRNTNRMKGVLSTAFVTVTTFFTVQKLSTLY